VAIKRARSITSFDNVKGKWFPSNDGIEWEPCRDGCDSMEVGVSVINLEIYERKFFRVLALFELPERVHV
jgi:hypothetical protein